MSEIATNNLVTDPAKLTRVLLIDDSKVMRRSALKMLGKNFDVVVAEDGQQGWSMIQQDPSIHVVFTDLNMPKMNGYQLLEAVRTSEDEGIRGLPVIVVTGAENDDEAKEQALDKGATDFITKPFNSTDLKARAQAHAHYQRTTKTLQKTAVVDVLTGLCNGRSFREAQSKDVSFVSRHKHGYALMYVEVDHFNDLFLRIGRKGADSLVLHVAKVLMKSVRAEDTVGRVGLARFAISLPTVDQQDALNLAQRICDKVAGFRASLGGQPLQINVSVGIFVPGSVSVESLDALQQQAQDCLGEAVDNGGNQVVCRAEPAAHETETIPTLEPLDLQPLSVDALLQQVAEQGPAAVEEQMPQLLRMLSPLWPLLTADQKAQLKADLDAA